MPINWDEFDSNIDSIIKEAAGETDKRLASRISSVTRMTDEEVQKLFPDPADIKKLIDLMKIVKSSKRRNTKINHIVSNAEEYGGIVLTLLKKFV